MQKCPFCEIFDQQVSAAVVFQDEMGLALMDIYPLSRGHLLLIPGRHVALLEELSREEQAWLLNRLRQLVVAVRQALPEVQGENVLLNNGRAANQHIPHLHLHLIPRYRRDTGRFILQILLRMVNKFGRQAPLPELEALAKRIAAHLPQAKVSGRGSR